MLDSFGVCFSVFRYVLFSDSELLFPHLPTLAYKEAIVASSPVLVASKKLYTLRVLLYHKSNKVKKS